MKLWERDLAVLTRREKGKGAIKMFSLNGQSGSGENLKQQDVVLVGGKRARGRGKKGNSRTTETATRRQVE